MEFKNIKPKNEKLEKFETSLHNKKVAVIGLGVSNIPLLDYLYKQNSIVTIFDSRTEDKLAPETLKKVEGYGMQTSFGENYLEKLVGFDMIFRSPSCRPDLPQIASERERGAVLTSEIEMLLELTPSFVIGVTGSDGKTTTTSLIYEILKQSGYHCYLGGNIGIPLFTKLEEMTKEDIIVLELSSFQLMEMKASPQIAVITNISPNHLDIHLSYEEYIESKENIYLHQKETDMLVLNYDNEITRKMANHAKGRVKFFSSNTKLNEGYILDGNVIKGCDNKVRTHVLSTQEILLRGRHNYENVVTALTATCELVTQENAIEAVKNFKGVEHRLEFVRELDGVKWYNDSIGTSPTRTIAGLNSFDEEIILIAGGYDKHLDYTPLAKPIVENVTSLVLLGQTADKIYDAVTKELKETKKELQIEKTDNLEEAILAARKVSKKGQIVLLSPASAAFDQFKNFAERGEVFKKLLNQLT